MPRNNASEFNQVSKSYTLQDLRNDYDMRIVRYTNIIQGTWYSMTAD